MGRQSGEPLEERSTRERVRHLKAEPYGCEQSGFDDGSGALYFLTEKAIKLYRTIRTGKLKALLPLHTRPINVVVFHGS